MKRRLITVCKGCGKVRDREDRFQDVVLTVKDHKTILDSLKTYVTPTELTGLHQDDKETKEEKRLIERGDKR